MDLIQHDESSIFDFKGISVKLTNILDKLKRVVLVNEIHLDQSAMTMMLDNPYKIVDAAKASRHQSIVLDELIEVTSCIIVICERQKHRWIV